MQPTPDFDAAKLARSLLRRSRQGALATVMVGNGDPYCSLVNVASHADGSPILLISRLAVHTRNILADSRVSLMLDERAEGDPLEGSRIMLAGRAEEAGADDLPVLRRRYLNAHPSSEAFVNFNDFSFFRIRPSGAHLVAGFGRIVDLRPAQLLTDISDAGALLEAERGAIDHMNADPGCLARRSQIGAAPAATLMGSTCRPAQKRCGWIFRGGLSPLPRCGRR